MGAEDERQAELAESSVFISDDRVGNLREIQKTIDWSWCSVWRLGPAAAEPSGVADQ